MRKKNNKVKLRSPFNAKKTCKNPGDFQVGACIMRILLRPPSPRRLAKIDFCCPTKNGLNLAIRCQRISYIRVFPKIVGFPPQIIHGLIGFSILKHPFWGTTIFGTTHIRRMEGNVTFPPASQVDLVVKAKCHHLQPICQKNAIYVICLPTHL